MGLLQSMDLSSAGDRLGQRELRAQVTDGRREAHVHNGTPMLTQITAAGCSLNAYIAAMLTVHPDAFEATTCAMAAYGCAASPSGHGQPS